MPAGSLEKSFVVLRLTTKKLKNISSQGTLPEQMPNFSASPLGFTVPTEGRSVSHKTWRRNGEMAIATGETSQTVPYSEEGDGLATSVEAIAIRLPGDRSLKPSITPNHHYMLKSKAIDKFPANFFGLRIYFWNVFRSFYLFFSCFVAGAVLCGPCKAHFVAGAGLCGPWSAEFEAGAGLFVGLEVQISWQV